jgi:hypothetical protein
LILPGLSRSAAHAEILSRSAQAARRILSWARPIVLFLILIVLMILIKQPLNSTKTSFDHEKFVAESTGRAPGER